MPVTSGQYAENESQIFVYLTTTAGYNAAAACGILANIEKESGFNPQALGDSGTSYGLCQWHNERWDNLKSYCRNNSLDSSSVTGQLSYLIYELKKDSSLWQTLINVSNTAEGAYNAAYEFCVKFEIPADKYTVGATRGNIARNNYFPYYSNSANVSKINSVMATGDQIVKIAKDQIGKPYREGTIGPSYFDSPGLIYYCYQKAGYDLGMRSISSYYQDFSTSKKVITGAPAPGDIIFYKNPRKDSIEYMAIATGKGTHIYTFESSKEVVEAPFDNTSGTASSSIIVRILSESETTPTGSYSETFATDTGLSYTDPYEIEEENNLSRVAAEGYDYGYLIDMTHGGEFKFYIPEFSEQAGANWNSIVIRGRSVEVLSYESTNSRKITVSLDLYAGAGLYEAATGESGEDVVSRLHQDAYFLKSLEYPDYSLAIARPPSTVQLILGSAVNIIGVVSGVSIEHLKPLDSQNRSMYLKASFTVTQIATNPPDWSDIKAGRYSIASTADPDSMTPLTTRYGSGYGYNNLFPRTANTEQER